MSPAYFLNAPTAKVGKSARRNLRFLHFLARYVLYKIEIAYRTFAENFSFRIGIELTLLQRCCRSCV